MFSMKLIDALLACKSDYVHFSDNFGYASYNGLFVRVQQNDVAIPDFSTKASELMHLRLFDLENVELAELAELEVTDSIEVILPYSDKRLMLDKLSETQAKPDRCEQVDMFQDVIFKNHVAMMSTFALRKVTEILEILGLQNLRCCQAYAYACDDAYGDVFFIEAFNDEFVLEAIIKS